MKLILMQFFILNSYTVKDKYLLNNHIQKHIPMNSSSNECVTINKNHNYDSKKMHICDNCFKTHTNLFDLKVCTFMEKCKNHIIDVLNH